MAAPEKAYNELLSENEHLREVLKKVLVECSWCGDEYTDEERESPLFDDGGNPMCDDCYYETYCFECCKCQGYELEHYQGGIGCLFVVVNDEANIPSGLYKVVEHPYWQSDMFKMGIIESSVQKISDQTYELTENDTNGYAIGHLCRECAASIQAQVNEEGDGNTIPPA